MKNVCLYGVLLLSVATFAACKGGQVRTEPVRISVVETIPATEAPKWVNGPQDFWEEKQTYFYRGVSEGFTNLETARRAAQAVVQTGIAEQVKNTVRVEFSRALESGMYDETTGGYVKDVFFSAVENLTLSGVRINESYIQRLQEIGENRDKLYYRAYVLGSIGKKDYQQLISRAFADTKAQVSANQSAKQLVAETEARFWQKQQNN